MPVVENFDSIIGWLGDKPKLLMGNGFSQAWSREAFSYDALFDSVSWGDLPPIAREAFDSIDTRDFEVGIDSLQRAASLLESNSIAASCSCSEDIRAELLAGAAAIKNALADAIASKHPDRPAQVREEEFGRCRQFLAHFDTYYTLNYDLLLYWTLMQTELGPPLKHDDGFRQPETGPEDYVVWESTSSHTQNAYYLHGACYLFDAKTELQKYTWANTGVRLIDQVRTELDRNHFPLVITEGQSEQKFTRIMHSAYLHKGYKSLASIGKPLCVYGWSFADNDRHIKNAIVKNKTKKLAVSLYGDPDDDGNVELVHRVGALIAEIEDRRNREVAVRYFHAESAQVWR